MDGLKEKTDLLDKFNALSAAMGDPDADFDKLLTEQAEVQVRSVDHIQWQVAGMLTPKGTIVRTKSTRWTAGTWST